LRTFHGVLPGKQFSRTTAFPLEQLRPTGVAWTTAESLDSIPAATARTM
jgi:hypothetical protein